MSRKTEVPHTGRLIRNGFRTSASPRWVWEAWANPARTSEWFTDRAEGEARAGSGITWYWDRFGYVVPYEVFAAVPDEQLVLTGQPPGRPRFYLEVEIEHHGGETLVTLINSGFLDGGAWDDEFEGISSGWQMALATLKLYLEKYFGRPRTQFMPMRPVRVDALPDLLPYYRTASGLARWLTDSGEVGEPNSRYALTLKGGGGWTGHVLVVTKAEVLLEANEIGGCVGLKAFAKAGEKSVNVWSPFGPSTPLIAKKPSLVGTSMATALTWSNLPLVLTISVTE